MADLLDRLKVALADRYEIERELGRGGMATVYLAHDLRHERRVAVKVLHPELAATIGPERFLREIRIAAQLTHPHILPLHDSGRADSLFYYVMPFIEGESLRQRLQRETQLPIPDVLEIAAQLGAALDYAHRAGIIHRDIKPENVLLHEGNALLADFGIAAAVTAAAGDRLTETGLSVGTPQYMSPEQATGGRQLDARSDVYALGAVVYEMLVGEPPHTGPTPQAIVAKLMTERPVGIRVVRNTVPESVERAVLRALSALPVDRFATAGEFAAALQRPSPVAADALSRRHWWRRRLDVAVATGLVVVVGLALVWIVGSRPGTAPAPTHRQLTFTGRAVAPAVSPDGRLFAFVVDNAPSQGRREAARLMVQQVSTGEAAQVGEPIWNVRHVRFARDGTGLVYAADSSNESPGVYWASLLGGRPRRVGTEYVSFGQAVDGTALLLVAPSFAESTLAITQPFADASQRDTTAWPADTAAPMGFVDWLDWAPDRRWIAVVSRGRGDEAVLSVVSLDGAMRSIIATDGRPGWLRSPRWSRGGDALYYVRGDVASDLMKVRINGRTGRPIGEPGVLLNGIPMGDMDLTDDGRRMVYDRGEGRSQLWTASLPRRPSGDSLALDRFRGGTGFDHSPAISPDGRQVAFVRGWGRPSEIHVQPLEGGPARRITSNTAHVSDVQWSPDGTHLAFVSDVSGEYTLMVVSLTELSPHRVGAWATSPQRYVSPRLAWIRDTSIVYVGVKSKSPFQTALRVVNPVSGADRAIPLSEGDSLLTAVIGSPDGNHVLVQTARREERSLLWLMLSLAHGSAIELAGLDRWAVAWSEGGRIFSWRRHEGDIQVWSIRSSGGEPVLHGRLPPRCTEVSVSRDGSLLICQESAYQSDIWLVENFDPANR